MGGLGGELSFESDGGHGAFGGAEKKGPGCVLKNDTICHAVGDTGDEIGDVIQADERGHCFDEGFASLKPGERFALFLLQDAAVDVFIGSLAVEDGGFLERGTALEFGFSEGGGRKWIDHGGLR